MVQTPHHFYKRRKRRQRILERFHPVAIVSEKVANVAK